MGNNASVANETNEIICVFALNLLSSNYCNNEIHVIPPGEAKQVAAFASPYGLQIAVISDIDPVQVSYSYDRWWVKSGSTLTVSNVDRSDLMVTAEGLNCANDGRRMIFYETGNISNFCKCLNIFDSSLNGLTIYHDRPHVMIDNTFGSESVKLLEVTTSYTSNYVSEIESAYDFHTFPPGSVRLYCYVNLVSSTGGQIVCPEDWDILKVFHDIKAFSHLRLRNGNRYSFFPDPIIQQTTILVSSMTSSSQYLKVLPINGLVHNHVLRILTVIHAIDHFHTSQVRDILKSTVAEAKDEEVSPQTISLSDLSLHLQLLPTAPSNVPNLIEDRIGWFRYWDTGQKGALTIHQLIQAVQMTFGGDLNVQTLNKLAQSVRTVWDHFLSDVEGLEASMRTDEHAFLFMSISLEVFLAPEGMGEALAEYIAPIYATLDSLMALIGSVAPVVATSPLSVSIPIPTEALHSSTHHPTNRPSIPEFVFPEGTLTRQYVHDTLLSLDGNQERASIWLQQQYPSLRLALLRLNGHLPAATATAGSIDVNVKMSTPVPEPSSDSSGNSSINAGACTGADQGDHSVHLNLKLSDPVISLCAQAAYDIYLSTSGTEMETTNGNVTGTPTDTEAGINGNSSNGDSNGRKKVVWRHLASGDVDIGRNELTRWAIWQAPSNAATTTATTTNTTVSHVPLSVQPTTTTTTILVFRGTALEKSFQDILHDAMLQPVKVFPAEVRAPHAVYVHAGFFTAIENILEEIVHALQMHRIELFMVTGHSLGGALAQVFGLKYLVTRVPACNNKVKCTLQAMVTFGAPMILWSYEEDGLAQHIPTHSHAHTQLKQLHPWAERCINFMYRADPVPLLPRLLSCKFCWNALVRVVTTNSWVGTLLAQKYISVPEEGPIPEDSVYHTLKFTHGFMPPGKTVVLFGKSRSATLSPAVMKRLATTFDTYVRVDDRFHHHQMDNYLQSCLEAAEQGKVWPDSHNWTDD